MVVQCSLQGDYNNLSTRPIWCHPPLFADKFNSQIELILVDLGRITKGEELALNVTFKKKSVGTNSMECSPTQSSMYAENQTFQTGCHNFP